MQKDISRYLIDVRKQFDSGHAKEHAYRPALQRLLESYEDTIAVNDPKQSEFGAPDFILLKESNKSIIKGYAETKDIDINLDRVEKSEQMNRYTGYSNLFLTNYLEFRFYSNGDKYSQISMGYERDGKLIINENIEVLAT